MFPSAGLSIFKGWTAWRSTRFLRDSSGLKRGKDFMSEVK